MSSATPPTAPKGSFLKLLSRAIDIIGQATSLLIFALIGILLFGVIMRYVINIPSVWVSELSGMIYAVYFLIGGSYALIHNEHVNVNIFRERLSARGKAILDLVTWVMFYIMIGTIFWLGIKYAWTSILRFEKSSTVWGPYIWPIKLAVPVSAFLMLVAGAIKTARDIKFLLTGYRPAELDSRHSEVESD